MPDIDLDFRDDRRAEMMAYTAQKYGDDKVAQIITFGTMKARAAIRDVGRVKDIPISEVDRIAKLIPAVPGKPVTIEQALETVPEFKQIYDSAGYIKDLIDTAQGMEGVVRNAGTHAAGVVVTDRPVVEYLPLHRPTGSSAEDSPVKTVTQFEMSIIDAQGLLKVDFLGLSTLTVMARACDLICERHGVELNLNNIPLDDPKTYALLGRGETAGVFQVEGSGMRRNLMEMQPKNLDHVIAMVALFRPGPMDFIPSYIARMHGEEDVTYLHPKLEPILKETYGITVYQEQIMYTAMNLGGYSASEADFLRKTVAKKKEAELLKQRDRFVSGAFENDVPEDAANAIFDNWEAFARYGFPKGHAADYGVISVQTGYLKTHYPAEYMTALLAVEQNNTDKVTLYVADCRRMGIEVLPPDINSSNWDFTIDDRDDGTTAIRFGLGAVKNVGHGPVDILCEARIEGKFADINDLIQRADLRKVGKRALECLIKVGALDSFGDRPSLLENLDRIVAISNSHFKAADAGQMSLFGADTGLVEEIHLPPAVVEITRREQLNWERELIGVYISDHPLSPVMDAINQNVTHFSSELAEGQAQQVVRVAGLITRIRPHTTKKGAPMAFVTLEDLQGNIDLVIFPRTWKRVQSFVDFDAIVMVDGKIDTYGAEPKVLVDKITTELKHVLPLEQSAPQRRKPASRKESQPRTSQLAPPKQEVPPLQADPASVPPSDQEAKVAAEKPVDYAPPDVDDDVPWDDDGLPPPPDAFPPEWDEMFEPVAPAQVPVEAYSALISAVAEVSSEDIDQPNATESTPETADHALKPKVESQTQEPEAPITPMGVVSQEPIVTESDPEDPIVKVEIPEKITSPIIPPMPAADGQDVNMITVILRPRADKVRDNLLLRRVFGLMISYPGNDRFALHIFENGRGHLLEFPNLTTGMNPELMGRLNALVGPENIRIEPITFQ